MKTLNIKADGGVLSIEKVLDRKEKRLYVECDPVGVLLTQKDVESLIGFLNKYLEKK